MNNKNWGALALGMLSLALATPAISAPKTPKPTAAVGPTLGSTGCALSNISPAASGCVGWYEGNLNAGSAGTKADSAAALNSLLGVTTYSGSTLTWLEDITVSGSNIDFGTHLFGTTIVSFHVGGANGQPGGVGYNGTAFYVFDAGQVIGGLDQFTFNVPGLSNARLYSTSTGAIPEASTWAMMLMGFGAIGWTMRSRRRQTRLAV